MWFFQFLLPDKDIKKTNLTLQWLSYKSKVSFGVLLLLLNVLLPVVFVCGVQPASIVLTGWHRLTSRPQGILLLCNYRKLLQAFTESVGFDMRMLPKGWELPLFKKSPVMVLTYEPLSSGVISQVKQVIRFSLVPLRAALVPEINEPVGNLRDVLTSQFQLLVRDFVEKGQRTDAEQCEQCSEAVFAWSSALFKPFMRIGSTKDLVNIVMLFPLTRRSSSIAFAHSRNNCCELQLDFYRMTQ